MVSKSVHSHNLLSSETYHPAFSAWAVWYAFSTSGESRPDKLMLAAIDYSEERAQVRVMDHSRDVGAARPVQRSSSGVE